MKAVRLRPSYRMKTGARSAIAAGVAGEVVVADVVKGVRKVPAR